MNKGAVIGLSAGAAVFAALALYAVENPSKNFFKITPPPPTDPTNPESPNNPDYVYLHSNDFRLMQEFINHIMLSDDIDAWRKWREDRDNLGPNVDNNKYNVWMAARDNSGAHEPGRYHMFYYPNIDQQTQLNEDGRPNVWTWAEDIGIWILQAADTVGDFIGDGDNEPEDDEGWEYDGG